MSVQISHEANTALTWAFGAYADKDIGIPFDIVRAADIPESDISKNAIDNIAKTLIQGAVTDGCAGRVVLGWCTFMKDGRFGIGVMALQRTG